MQTFELHEAIRATLARFPPVACEIADDLPRRVVGDVGGAMALLERLVEHSAGRGEVSVTVSRDLGHRVRFQVAHTGPGMTPEASLEFVHRLNPDLGIHTAPQAGSTVWFFARLDPA